MHLKIWIDIVEWLVSNEKRENAGIILYTVSSLLLCKKRLLLGKNKFPKGKYFPGTIYQSPLHAGVI